MNKEFYNLSRDLEQLTQEDMFAISQELNTIEPSVGEVARVLPFFENLTFLDTVSILFVMTLLVFSIAPLVKKTKVWKFLRPAS